MVTPEQLGERLLALRALMESRDFVSSHGTVRPVSINDDYRRFYDSPRFKAITGT